MTPEIAPPSRVYRWLLFAVAALALGVDQWTKARIIEWIAIGDSWRPYVGTPILELFAFTHIKNMGAAFGMFQTGGWFFIIVATVVSIFISFYAPRIPRHQWYTFLALGLTMGGALGNLVDRLRLGWVTDFIHVGDFAIFNIADSCVVTGVIILFVIMWREDEERKRVEDAAPPAPAAATPDEGVAPAALPFATSIAQSDMTVADVPENPTESNAEPEFAMERSATPRLMAEVSSDS
jgi:signal peptidase II